MKKQFARFEIFFSILLMSSIFYNMGCSGTTTNSSFDPVSSVPASSGTLPGTSTGQAAPTDFFVGILADPNSVATVRTSSDFTASCSVSASASSQDVTCIVDIPEGDLFINGLTLTYNVPAGLCKYLQRTPYWFYNKEVGVAPKTIVVNNLLNASGDITSTTCTFNAVASSVDVTSNTCFDSEITVSTSGSTTCAYDDSGSGGSNCCFGSKNITVNRIPLVGAPTSTLTSSNWGGSADSCTYVGDWPSSALDVHKLPKPIVESSLSGLRGNYKITAPILKAKSLTTLGASNFYNSVNHTHGGLGPVVLLPATRTTRLPYYVDPVDDRNGTLIPGTSDTINNFLTPGEDSYKFECLDESHEVKHRIKVYIREWDTYLDFTNYIAGQGTPAIFDRNGAEGTTCSGVSGSCNDYFDADDFLSSQSGGIYNVTDPDNRGAFFPEL